MAKKINIANSQTHSFKAQNKMVNMSLIWARFDNVSYKKN